MQISVNHIDNMALKINRALAKLSLLEHTTLTDEGKKHLEAACGILDAALDAYEDVTK